MDTHVHIDYLSISTPHAAWSVTRGQDDSEIDYYERAAFAALSTHPTFCHESKKDVPHDMVGTFGFKFRRFYPTFGWMLFGGAAHGRILLQMPGEACHGLRVDTDSAGQTVGLRPFLEEPRNRITRIDIAGNWRTQLSVDAVASAFQDTDLSKYRRDPSGTGMTQWLTGQTSEQRAVVYRYYPPHPRSDWLRIEFRLFGESAENARASIISEGLLPTYKALLASKNFSDPNMLNALGVGHEAAKIAYQRRQRAGSLKWLYGVAMKSIKTAIQTGILDRDELIRYLDQPE